MLGARAARLMLIGAGASLVLGACGHAATVGSDRVLSVALTEYRVAPQKIHVSPGALTILVHNNGKLTHNLAVLQGDQRIGETDPIWPGTTSELSVVVTRGRYTLASTLFSDQALGEYGTLTVTR